MRHRRTLFISIFVSAIRRLHFHGPPSLTVAVALLFPAMICIASVIDGTFIMRGKGSVGLSRHYGYWAMFATTPLIILATMHLVRTATAVIREVDHYCVGMTMEMSGYLIELKRRCIQRLSLREQSPWTILVALSFLGCWSVNIINTVDPYTTYQHDVFDAYRYHHSFYAVKAYLLFVFGGVYFASAFTILRVNTSLRNVLDFIFRHDVLSIDFFHPDDCGGTSRIGAVNLIILVIYLCCSIVAFSMFLAHGHLYFAIAVVLPGFCLIVVAQSVGAVFDLHRAIAQKKRQQVAALSARLNAHFVSSLHGEHFPSNMLALRNHLTRMRTFPYAMPALIGVNVIQGIEVGLLVWSHWKK